MKLIKTTTILMLSLIMCFSTILCVCAKDNVEATGNYSLSGQSDNFEELTTPQSENNISYSSAGSMKNRTKNTQLFFVETTFLALVVGYLILFKKKGVNLTKEKMHAKTLHNNIGLYNKCWGKKNRAY